MRMVCKGSSSRLEHDPQATSALQYNVREYPSEHPFSSALEDVGL